MRGWGLIVEEGKWYVLKAFFEGIPEAPRIYAISKGKDRGGTIIYPDGMKYVGEWKNDKRHGQGAYTFPDGRVDRGIWENDKLEKLVE